MWYEYLIFGIVGAPLTLVLHELSHCVVIWINKGTEVTGFKPWPHFVDEKLYFGRMTWRGTIARTARLFLNASPVIKGKTFGLLWMILALLVYPPLFMLWLWEMIDVVWWWRGYWWGSSRSDGSRFKITKGT